MTELVIVVFLMGVMIPVLAMAFVVVIRTTPTAEDRADDSRSLLNLTTWLSKDVSSTSESGFYIGSSAPTGGCEALPASSTNLLELHWSEATENFVTNYRWVPTGPLTGPGRIVRYACQQGEAGTALNMTAELNSMTTGAFHPAPVEITSTATTLADGSSGIKGLQFVVLINDEYGVRRELLSLDATTTNVRTTLPDVSDDAIGTNTAPIASDLSMTIAPGSTKIETLPAVDPDGDPLVAAFPNPLPAGWTILANGITLEVNPDPAAVPGDYDITYSVTDPSAASATAILKVTIPPPPPTPNLPPIAMALSLNASKGEVSSGLLDYSDPEGGGVTAALVSSDIPAGWSVTLSDDQVSVTPSLSASGPTVIRYTVTDDAGATAISQITVNVCTVTLDSVSPSPTTVAVSNKGVLESEITVRIKSNGACKPLVLGFLPNDNSQVESTVNFDASNVATIARDNSFAWTPPKPNEPLLIKLNVRDSENGPAELTIDLTTTRQQGQ